MIFIPDSGSVFSHPGSWIQGSRKHKIRIRNTGSWIRFLFSDSIKLCRSIVGFTTKRGKGREKYKSVTISQAFGVPVSFCCQLDSVRKKPTLKECLYNLKKLIAQDFEDWGPRSFYSDSDLDLIFTTTTKSSEHRPLFKLFSKLPSCSFNCKRKRKMPKTKILKIGFQLLSAF